MIPPFRRRFIQDPRLLEMLAEPLRKGIVIGDIGDIIVDVRGDGRVAVRLAPHVHRQIASAKYIALHAGGAVDDLAQYSTETVSALVNLREALDQSFPFDFDISSATTHDVVTLAMPAGKTKFFVNRLVFECKTQGTGTATNASVVLKRAGGGNIFNSQSIPIAAQDTGKYVRISNVGVGVDVCGQADTIQLQVVTPSGRNSIMTGYVLGTFV